METAVGGDAGTAAHDRQRQPLQHQAGPHHGLQLRGVPVHRLGLREAVSQAAHHRHHIPPGTTATVDTHIHTAGPLSALFLSRSPCHLDYAVFRFGVVFVMPCDAAVRKTNRIGVGVTKK